jgi:hypothetical protein
MPCTKAVPLTASLTLRRDYNAQASNYESHLLHLPELVLEAIARKMGKQACLVSAKLCALYGSPGGVLCPPKPAARNLYAVAMRWTLCNDVIGLWRYPNAVGRLVVSDHVIMDSHACRTVAGALPHLRELECGAIDPTGDGMADARRLNGFPTHAALTSLRARSAPNDVRRVVAFAPNLRRLRIGGCTSRYSELSAGELWGALASLRGLQSLQLPVHEQHLSPPDSLCAALSALTRLTHLGLDHDKIAAAAAVPSEHAQQLAQALAALPHLASVELGAFRRLGSPLGPALQALRLESLHLRDQCSTSNDATLQNLEGCLPALSAMPLLRHLAMSGERLLFSAELQRVFGAAGSTPLRALEMRGMAHDQLPAVCEALGRVPALTRLSLEFIGMRDSAMPGHDRQLASALSTLTQLHDLEVHSLMRFFVPRLKCLPSLTSLGLSFHGGRAPSVVTADLRRLAALTGLRKLALPDGVFTRSARALLASVLGRLRLLEELAFQRERWSGDELLLALVPPPERLRRVTLLTARVSCEPPVPRDAVRQLVGYGVNVRMP